MKDSGCFSLVLVSPAPFQQGWLPDGINQGGVGTLGGIEVQLVGASIGRFKHIGGWNIVFNRPKPTRRAVPAGSVYFFRFASNSVSEKDVNALFEAVFGRSVCARPDDQKLGLGLGYIGYWEGE